MRGEQTGTRTEIRLVRDPEGPIVREETRNVHGPGGPDEWRIGQFGHNALAGVALRRANVGGTARVLDPMLEFYDALLEANGLLDLTVDLAWIVVFMAESGQSRYQKWVPDLVAKLMAGQIREGAARGLWGPLALNPDLLAAHWRVLWHHSEAHRALVERFGEEPRRDSERRQVDAAAVEVDRARRALEAYTWTHRKPEAHADWVELRNPLLDEPIRVRRPPEYLFNQLSADLESTWLALYAIRIARDHGLVAARLPEIPQTPRDPRSRTPAPHVQPLPGPAQILQEASAAIVRHAHGSGAFPEINLHQPVRVFDDLSFLPGVPLPRDISFPELPSPVTLSATAQGFSALTQIGRVLGMSALAPQAQGMARAKLLLDSEFERGSLQDPARIGESGLGVFSLGLALLDSGPPIPGADRALRAELLRSLLAQQRPDGLWNAHSSSLAPVPTVTLQRIQTLPLLHRDPRAFDHARAFAPFPLESEPNRQRARQLERFGYAQPVLTTAIAVLLLAEELRGEEALGVPPE